MSNAFLPPIDPRSYIRTYVPIGVGLIIGWLLTQFTAVANAIAWADSVLPAFGFDWRDLLNAAAIAAVTALYYWGARQIGRRFPNVEKWLLGSSAVPVYTAR